MKNYFDGIFCINLPNHERRRQTITMEFDSVGFNMDRMWFVHAKHGSELAPTQQLLADGILANPFVDPGGNLTKNIIACAMSHKMAYNQMIDLGHEVSLIIEDDVTWTKTGLRVLANGTLEKMVEDFKNSEYDIMWLGTCDTNIPVYRDAKTETGLYEYMRYLPEWAGHAYVIKRSAALALLANNTPIKHAADVNIECSNVKICAPRKSFLSQNGGEFERPVENRLRMRFDLSVVKNIEENQHEYMPTTTQINEGELIEYVDSPDNLIDSYNTLDRKHTYHAKVGLANVSLLEDLDYIKYMLFETGNKDLIENWAHLYFKQ